MRKRRITRNILSSPHAEAASDNGAASAVLERQPEPEPKPKNAWDEYVQREKRLDAQVYRTVEGGWLEKTTNNHERNRKQWRIAGKNVPKLVKDGQLELVR